MTTDAQTEARAIFTGLAVAFGSDAEREEIIRRIATALAAKDAELAETRQERMDVIVERNELRAQLAEARKALREINREAKKNKPDPDKIWDAARRALEAQGGENG